MNMIKVSSDNDEVSATITKGYLESNGVKTSIGPGNDSLIENNPVLRGPNVRYEIYVSESDSEKAQQLLNERF